MKRKIMISKIIAIFIMAAMVLQLMPTLVFAGPVNVALGKTVTGDGYDWGNLVDGDTGTSWYGTGSGTDTITIDLGDIYTITQAVIKYSFIMELTLSDADFESSIDGDEYIIIEHITGDYSNVSTLDYSGDPQTGRYFRLSNIQSMGGIPEIKEIELYGELAILAPQWAEGYPNVTEEEEDGVELAVFNFATTTENCWVYDVCFYEEIDDITPEKLIHIVSEGNLDGYYLGKIAGGNSGPINVGNVESDRYGKSFADAYYVYAVLENQDTGECSEIANLSFIGESEVVDGEDTDAEGNEYFFDDNGDGTATITSFIRNGDTSVVIPETLDGLNVAAIINGGVFMSKGLTSVSIPSTVTTIGDNAFRNNSLTSLTIPDNVTSIANDAFRDNSISSVVFGSNLTTIGNGIFANNQLTSITIPARFTNIGGSAFQSNLLTEVIIENAAATIYFTAFLSNQTDDPSALTIHGYTGSTAEGYADDNGHTFIALDGGGGEDIPDGFEVVNGNYYEYDDNGDGTATITYFEMDVSSDIEIPSTVDGLTVVAIGDSAFEDCGVTSVVIPNTVESIGEYAFADNGLTSATISYGVISIGYGAFAYNELDSVIIPASVTSIGGEAFYYNQIESVSIGNSVESIGDYAFSANRLTSVIIENSTVALGDDVFAENQDDDPTALTIHGYTGSTAEDYADIYGYTFVPLDGSGGTDNPTIGTDYTVDGAIYTLKTALGLVWFSTQVNNGNDFSGKTIELEGDIDLSGTDWMPIGSSDNLFNGSFDGKSYKISNLTIAAEDKSEVGFFGVIGAAGAANNIILEDITITAVSNHDLLIGGIAGANMGSIANSHITTSTDGESIVSASGDFLAAGGITGFNLGNISESSNSATIEVGGGNGKPSYNAGGIASTNFGAIDNSFNTGTIRDTGGTADAYVKLGGIVGRNNFNDLEGQIHFTYNIGEISLSTSGDDKIKAGIAGYSKDALKITDSFFLEGTAEYGFSLDQGTGEPTPSSEGAAPKTEAELKNSATFAGWDVSKWVITDGSMPVLKGLVSASPTYTVTYDGNGHSGGTVPVDNSNYLQGNSVTVLGNIGNLTKTGYIFAGWNTSANGSGTNYTTGATVTMESVNVMLYAKWTASAANTYTVTFNSQGDSAVAAITDIASGSTITAPTSPTRSGYIFGGWYKETACINAWNFNADTVTSNITLYAKWTVAGGSGNGRNSSTPAPIPSLTNSNTGISLNGETQNNAATMETEVGANGQTTTTVTLDQKKVEEILSKLPDAVTNTGTTQNPPVITIPVAEKADTVVGELDGKMVKNMENKNVILEIKTETATYSLPAQQIDISAVSQSVGQDVKLSDIKVQIEIAKPTDTVVKVVEDSANKGNFTLVVPPVEFKVSCTYENKTVEVSQFNNYVERTVAIPDGVDPSKITTGVVVDPDGTVRHVPTKIIVIDGKYYAKINSLTNSTYSVVWHPIEFKDTSNHWAEEAINDMGSRMVISGDGNGNFAPDRDITRAEFAAILVRTLGLKPGIGISPFTDAKGTDWYSSYVITAAEYKIISGYGNDEFGPNDKITREQAMTMISRAMNITGPKVEFASGEVEKLLAGFGDADKSESYAKVSIASCIKAGIVSGRNGNLVAPKENITRAEVAVIVRRLLQESNLI